MLCRVTTSDGLVLDGGLLQPPTPSPLAYVFVHGTGSNFYAPGILEQLAERAMQSGHIAIRVNTRGHDGAASIPGQSKSLKGGATFELVADCVHDINAWCDYLVRLGASRIVLVGHSMGGVKSIYSQAHSPHSAVCGIVCLSPPRFCHQHWMAHPQGSAFREHFALASRLVVEQQPGALFECRQPTPFVATAAGFIEKYGPDDRYDFVPLLGRVTVPALILLGDKTLTASPAFDTHPQEISRMRDAGVPVTFQLVTGTDMNYSNRADEIWRQISSQGD